MSSYDVIDKNVLSDLKFEDVIDMFDTTYIGRNSLRDVLTSPTDDHHVLSNRKSCLSKVESKISPEVDELFEKLKSSYDAVKWFRSEDAPEKEWLETTYLPQIARLITRENFVAFQAYTLYKTILIPLFAILAPLMYVFLPYMYIKFVCKLPVPFSMFIKIFSKLIFSSSRKEFLMVVISIAVYVQGIMTAVNTCMLHMKVNKFLWEKYHDMATFIDTAETLVRKFKDVDLTCFASEDTMKWDVTRIPKVYGKYSMLSNVGHILRHINNFDGSDLDGLIAKVSLIDALYSVTKAKSSLKLNYSRIIPIATYPQVKALNTWHVCIPLDKVIKNTIELGGDESANNAIITGPNAAGKSSFIKSIIINVILSQTIAMCACEHMEFTPFHKISTHMNVPDVNGEASLFEAEMKRCKEKLDVVQQTSPDKFVLYAMDEVFSSTQPIEGIAGAHAILRRLSTHRNSMGLITTHFIELTKLSQEEDFENYKMVVDRNENNDIIFPYKLQEGVSDQHIALELLEREGFDSNIIREAIQVRTALVDKKYHVENKDVGGEGNGPDEESRDACSNESE